MLGPACHPPQWLWAGDGNKEGLREELQCGAKRKLGDHGKGQGGAPVACCGGWGSWLSRWMALGEAQGPILPFRREWEVRKPLESFPGVLQ